MLIRYALSGRTVVFYAQKKSVKTQQKQNTAFMPF